MTLPRLTFVLGGARSGKSAYAESLLAGSSHRAYIATAQAFDEEMAARIAQHRLDRGEDWRTIDAPIDLCAAIGSLDGTAALLDCVTVWIGNLMHEERDVNTEIDKLVDHLTAAPGPLVVVSNEVGLGIVPDNAMARRFRDFAGRLNQKLAAVAPRVVLVTAGIPQILKDE